jgi:hypothetical protein
VARARRSDDRQLPLGLEEGTLSVLASGGRIEGKLKLRGKRLGEMAGDFSAASSRMP